MPTENGHRLSGTSAAPQDHARSDDALINLAQEKTGIAATEAAIKSAIASAAPRFNFALLCLGGFCFATAYGMTFLLPLLMAGRGADEAAAGNIISTATFSSVGAVILSGHLSDHLGPCRAAMVAGLLLAVTMFGFATYSDTGIWNFLLGFLLGLGWGTFYSLGPIIASKMMPADLRPQAFARLAGYMMAGIGTGPLIGRIAISSGFEVDHAFGVSGLIVTAGVASLAVVDRSTGLNGSGRLRSDKLSWSAAQAVLRSGSRAPILMIGVAGAVFGGLSSFQTSFAMANGVDFLVYYAAFMSAAIFARLILVTTALRMPQRPANFALTGLMALSIALLPLINRDPWLYGAAAALFGGSYGLLYSLLAGQTTDGVPDNHVSQVLLLFSLAYFVGAFGLPIFAGRVVIQSGINGYLVLLLLLALVNVVISAFRLTSNRI